MPDRLQKTAAVLARSRNRAVLPVLAAGLRSSSAAVRVAAIRATVRRTDRESHAQLIRHFASFGDTELAALGEAYSMTPHHTAQALKVAVLKGSDPLCENACRMIVLFRDYDLFSTLVQAATDNYRGHAAHAVPAISQLAQRLHDDLIQWTASAHRSGNDPSFARHHVLTALEHSLACYNEHGRSELLDAFLLLAPSNNAALLRIMHEGQHPCHVPLISALAASESAGVIERLVGLLRDTDAPEAAIQAVAGRTDRAFVQFLFRELKHPVPLRVLHNMKRLRSIAWLQSHRECLLELDGRAQAMAVDLATSSVMDLDSLFGLLAFLLQHGLAEARRAACQALTQFSTPEADELVLAALNDPDASVQAAAARQLRQRRLPNSLQMLVSLLESPSTEVRDAARSSLAEFNFLRYRAMFDLLDEHAVRTTGLLVRQVDQSVHDKLIVELLSPSVTSRLRAIEMAVAMQAVDDVREPLIELTQHENATIRQEAAAALSHATGSAVVKALELAAHDSHQSVVEAAQHSLAQLRLRSGATAGLSEAVPVFR